MREAKRRIERRGIIIRLTRVSEETSSNTVYQIIIPVVRLAIAS